MSERLYLQDPYTVKFTARIVERVLLPGGREAVTLDRTAFRPAEPSLAKLPGDRGWLNQAQVIDVIVREQDDEILHILSEEIWENEAQGRIMEARRFDAMRQHTGGHLLAEAFAQVCKTNATGIQVTDQDAALELACSGVATEQIEQAETLANELALSNRAVRVGTVTAAQAAKLGLVPISPQGYLLPGAAPVQVMSLDNGAPALCDGLHVARTGEIGLIKVTGVETRSDKLRVQYATGTRALAEFRRAEKALTQIAGSLNVPPANAAPAVAQLVDEFISAQKQLEAVRGTIGNFEADALAAGAELAGGARAVRRVCANREIGEVRQLARAIIARPGYVVMLGTTGAKAQLVMARSTDVRHDMTSPIRIAAQVLNTQGGGQPGWA